MPTRTKAHRRPAPGATKGAAQDAPFFGELKDKPWKDVVPQYYLYAFLLTVAVFLLVSWLFHIEEIEPIPKKDDHSPIIAVDLNGIPNEKIPPELQQVQRDLQQTVKSWLELLDPTIMSLSNLNHGFSSVIKVGSTMPLHPHEIELQEPILRSTPAFPRTETVEPVPMREEMVLPAALVELTDLPALHPSFPAFDAPQITDALGMRMAGLPDHLPLELVSKLTLNTKAKGPTILVTKPFGEGVRVIIQQSSGSEQLDLLARQYLMAQLIRLPDLQPESHAKTSETMQSWLAKPHTMVIHWRFAASLRDSIDPEADGADIDHPWY